MFLVKKGGLWELQMIVGVVLSKQEGPGQSGRLGRYGYCYIKLLLGGIKIFENYKILVTIATIIRV